MQVSFQSILKGKEGGPTGIEVPAHILAQLNSGRKPLVKVTVNNYKYRSAVATMKGVFMISFSAEHRSQSGISAGDSISVQLEVDSEPRTTTIPEPLLQMLNQNKLTDLFYTLAPSMQREYARQINEVKSQEAQSRRIDKIIQLLRAKK